MSAFIATLVQLWAMFGSIVFFVVVIWIAFSVPARFSGPQKLALAVRRIVGTLIVMFAILSVMMVASQWVLSQFFIDALSVDEMMGEAFIKGLVIYLMVGFPFILIRTFQLRNRVSAP